MNSQTLKVDTEKPPNVLFKIRSVLGRFSDRTLNSCVVFILFVLGCVAFYGLVTQDFYLCFESIFLAFIPYIPWSAYRRVGTLDVFAADVGFPLAYVVYLYVGSINLPIETQFGLVLPWIIWFYYIVGLIAYLVGARLQRKPNRLLALAGAPKVFWPRERFLSATLVLLAIGAIARGIAVSQFGVAIFHAQDEVNRTEGVGGLLGVLALCMDASFECLLLYLLIKKPGRIVRFAIVACMGAIILNAIATNNRTAMLRLVLAAFIIFHYAKRRFKFAGVVSIGLFVGIFASALGTFRDVSQWGEAHIEKLESQGFTSQTFWLMNGYEAVRLPPETFYMTIQEVPLITPYSYGATSLATVLQILPGHRPGPSEIVKTTLRLEFVGFGAASTILGPMWMDGGLLGIIIGMFLFGVVTRALHQRVIASRNYIWVLVYGWFLQNSLKAVKDDVLPELGFIWVIVLFVVVSFAAGFGRQSEEKDI